MTAPLDRRAFVVVIASGLLARRAAAQTAPARAWRIGLLVPGQPPGCGRDPSSPALIALREGFRERGYVEGQGYVLVVHCAVSEGPDMRQAAEDTARDKVDVVIVASNELARAIQKATTTVPVVFFAVTDPEEDGLVASLARPGGNITGLSHMTGDLAGKRLQLLKDTLPKLKKVAVLATQRHPPTERQCVRLGLDAQWFAAPEPSDIAGAFAAMKRARPEALLVLPHPMFWLERRRIVGQAAEIGVPAIYESKDFVTAGGLMAYGASLTDMARRGAGYVDRILKGTRPADLPVEQPTTFELVINRRAARSLGLTIPQSVLLRADQVID